MGVARSSPQEALGPAGTRGGRGAPGAEDQLVPVGAGQAAPPIREARPAQAHLALPAVAVRVPLLAGVRSRRMESEVLADTLPAPSLYQA